MPRPARSTIDLASAAFVTEADLAAACGLNGVDWQVAKLALRREGLPEPDPIIGAYWTPAVRAFFDKRAGLDVQSALKVDGKEKW